MSKHILLCDDEIAIVRATEIKLSRAGYRVTCCGNGRDALDAALRDLPDAVLTDCQMPLMSGLELICKLRENTATSTLPIFMLTAKGYELSAAELKEKWGVLGLIPKPFSPREVLKLVDGLFASEAV